MSDTLDRAIALLTDGERIDWEGLLEDASDPRERSLLEELRGLAEVDVEHVPLRDSASPGTLGLPGPKPSSGDRRRWAHLELLDDIGHGAYGIVYRAWDTRLGREVALKLLADDGGNSLDEARRLARISHPNVVTVYGADRADGRIGLWMQLLKGRTLDQMLADQGPFSAREAIGFGLDVCGAVAAVHAAGLVHRDIKAQNVLREPGGRIVLMDMGASIDLARDETAKPALTGTPLYMAPELFAGAGPSVASDIYAIGVLLYRLVTAEFPIQAETVGDLRRAHAESTVRPLRQVRPDLPPDFVAVVERCLAAEPHRRFPGAAALERALQDVSVGVLRSGARHRVRNMTLFGAAAIVGIVSGAFGWRYAARQSTASPSAPTARALTPPEYRVFAGFEELAFNRRIDDPAAAAAAVDGAYSQLRSALSGIHPAFALLNARLSEAWRHAGDLRQAAAYQLDGSAQALETIGEDHPYSAMLAMERARNAQVAGDHHTTAVEILRALGIRRRLLGLAGSAAIRIPPLDAVALERLSPRASCAEDGDGDGLLDLIEVAAGLNPRSVDSDGNGVLDDDEDRDRNGVSNRYELGLLASPFLTWAHYGNHDPHQLAWQVHPQFPMIERPLRAPTTGWSIASSHAMGFFFQRLSPAHARRATEAGFSLLARADPSDGLASLAVDAAPAGPRFDVAIRRLDQQSIELRLLSSVVPREGPAVVVNAVAGGRSHLLELRYRPRSHGAALYVDGHKAIDGYAGHHQFQDPKEGAVSWGVVTAGDGNPRAAAAFNLVWLEIF